jgi:hypothetical protein
LAREPAFIIARTDTGAGFAPDATGLPASAAADLTASPGSGLKDILSLSTFTTALLP